MQAGACSLDGRRRGVAAGSLYRGVSRVRAGARLRSLAGGGALRTDE